MLDRNHVILPLLRGPVLSLALLMLVALPFSASRAHADETTLLYTSINPCRVVDTRLAVGKFAAGEARSYNVAGVEDFSSTGGNPDGCDIPHAEALLGGFTLIPRAMALQVTSADAEGSGHFRGWPGGLPQQIASIVNFVVGDDASNMIILQVCDEIELLLNELCLLEEGGDFNIEAFGSDSHLVIDVLGYFHNAEL